MLYIFNYTENYLRVYTIHNDANTQKRITGFADLACGYLKKIIYRQK